MSTPELKTLEPGQILCATWGYDQTNATFVKVVKVTGQMATLQELETCNQWANDLSMTGRATPGPAKGKTMRRKVKAGAYGQTVKLFDFGGYARPWNGQPVNVSCYA